MHRDGSSALDSRIPRILTVSKQEASREENIAPSYSLYSILLNGLQTGDHRVLVRTPQNLASSLRQFPPSSIGSYEDGIGW